MKKKEPGKTPANPSAFSMSSSMGRDAIDSSLCWPNNDDDGYMLVPIPSRRPVSFAIASWSPGLQKATLAMTIKEKTNENLTKNNEMNWLLLVNQPSAHLFTFLKEVLRRYYV